jgi:phytoene dehydrogenase-like protein
MKKIVIIGGGIAGLSAGCYAKMNGFDAHIYEMHNKAGGLCTAWKRKGYTFDTCLHWLIGTHPQSQFNKIWQELGALQGKKIHYKDMGIHVRMKEGSVNFYSDPDKLSKEIEKIAPEDVHLKNGLADSLKTYYATMNMPLTKPKELLNIIDKIKMMLKFLPYMGFFKKTAKMTIDEYAHMYTNPVLQKALKAAKILSPNNAFIVIPFILITKDAGFPEGGSYALAKSIEERFTNLGGTIHYNSKIKKIITSKEKAIGVLLEDGNEVKADIVISAADGYETIFNMLQGKFINRKIKRIYTEQALIPSWLQVSVGVNLDLSQDISTRSIYNLYELETPIVIDGKKQKYLTVKNYAFDPTFAPKGKSTLVAGFMSDYNYWEKIYQDKEKYKLEKKKVETSVITNLEKIFPGIKNKIEAVDVSTPMTIHRYTNNRGGSIMGFMNSFTLNIPRTLPGLKNFFMVGHWVGDTGLPGAGKSGRDIVELICKQDKKKFITTIP